MNQNTLEKPVEDTSIQGTPTVPFQTINGKNYAVTPITSDMLIGNTTPMKLKERIPLTGAAGLQGAVEGVATSYANSKVEEQRLADQQANLKTEKSNVETSKQSLLDKILGRESKTALQDTAYTATVDPAKKELDDINNQILQEQLSARREIEALNGIGLTDVQRAQKAQEIQRVSASKQADLAVIQMAKQNNYARAKEIADRKINMLLEKDAQDIELLKFNYEENKDLFNKDETRQYNEMIAEKERSYKLQDSNLKTVRDLALEASKGGAPAPVATEMMSKSDPAEAMRIGGQYIGSLDRQKTTLELLKLKNEVEANAPITGEWASVVNGAAGLVASTKQKSVKMNIASALSNSNYGNAYAEIANAVADGLTGTNKTKFEDARTDIGVMQGMRKAINDYVSAGGDIGYLKGTAEQLANKFGQIANNPKFAALGVQLQREFQSYRNNMTGAAFSPGESREYASVNPRTNASLDLNLATIDGAIAQLSNRVTSTVNARVPDAQKIWDKIVSSNTSTAGAQQYKLKDGTVVTRQADGTYK